MEMEHHRVAFTRCLNGLNGRLGEQWLVVVVVYGRWRTGTIALLLLCKGNKIRTYFANGLGLPVGSTCSW